MFLLCCALSLSCSRWSSAAGPTYSSDKSRRWEAVSADGPFGSVLSACVLARAENIKCNNGGILVSFLVSYICFYFYVKLAFCCFSSVVSVSPLGTLLNNYIKTRCTITSLDSLCVPAAGTCWGMLKMLWTVRDPRFATVIEFTI